MLTPQCLLPTDCLWERRNTLITKAQKSEQVAELAEKFSKSKAVVLTEYKGLTVSEISDLRKILKEVGSEYKVAKNTLSIVASRGTAAESAHDMFVGPTGVAFAFDDPIATAKKIIEFAQKNDKLKVKSGIIDGKLCSFDELKAISQLPPREVLLSMLAGAFQAPASKLAAALNATVAQFAYAMDSLKNTKSE
ncbi:MAG: 50S ribosomal protein L10 [Thermodesulfovibrionales bacterium]|jgi:large subunit ribosomal protein L10